MTGHVYLVARVSSATLDSLAAFEIDRADLEPDGNDEPEERDQHLGGSHATDQTGWGCSWAQMAVGRSMLTSGLGYKQTSRRPKSMSAYMRRLLSRWS